MNKDLSRHIVVLDLVEFAIVLMDKIHVLGLDMLSECDQDDLSSVSFCCNNIAPLTGVCVSFSPLRISMLVFDGTLLIVIKFGSNFKNES